jgi:hypothetical protein
MLEQEVSDVSLDKWGTYGHFLIVARLRPRLRLVEQHLLSKYFLF